MRKVLKGKGVSNGIGFGKVVLLKPEDLKVEKSKIDNVKEETEKFNEALNSVIKDTEEIIKKSSGTEKDIMLLRVRVSNVSALGLASASTMQTICGFGLIY